MRHYHNWLYRNITVVICFCLIHILINIVYKLQQSGLKLGDFGSCRSVYSKPPHTEYISTRWYRAPECLLTDGYYGLKMDMWSAGCVFFEIMRYLCKGRVQGFICYTWTEQKFMSKLVTTLFMGRHYGWKQFFSCTGQVKDFGLFFHISLLWD